MKTILAVAGSGVLALGAFSFAQQQTQNAPQSSGQTGQNARSTEDANNRRNARAELNGVQSLFTQATNSAVMRDGFHSLLTLFGSENANAQGPTTAPVGGGARPSLKSSQPGPAGLNQVADQFNREWKQKYGRDFRVTDPALVCADITPYDILAGTPQLASSHLNGSTTRETSHLVPEAAGGPERSAGTAAVGDEVTVNVPSTLGMQAFTVRLVRTGPNSYRFATPAGAPDPQRLASALQAQLKQLIDQKQHWPIDAAQGERLVTQHVLLAISQVSSAGNENAQPAGLHLPGNKSEQGK